MRKLLHQFSDLIFPRICPICDHMTDTDVHLCASCLVKLKRIENPMCVRCGEPFSGAIEGTVTCSDCQNSNYAFLFARAPIQAWGEARDLIHGLKYEGKIYLAKDLAFLMRELISLPEIHLLLKASPLLVPVPLSRKRLRKRGYNQAAEIAIQLNRHIELPLVHALKRVRDTPTQVRLSRKKRQANLKDAFSLTKSAKKCEGRTILLIDDVFTTGSTAHECASTLISQAKAEKVVVLTAARG